MNHLKLETHDHPNAYTIRWIKKGVNMRFTKQCDLPLSLGKHYRSDVLCDVVHMDARHVLLGRPWQFDVDLHTRARKILTLSFGTREGSLFHQIKLMVISLKRRGKVC
jgi:hypothetical protein